jgi:lipopolysaccharide/colanic/teichoic acid biosynthesis glycosyltransferase
LAADYGMDGGSLQSPHTLYRRYGKRLLDASGATAGLLVLAPLLLLITLVVKCSSRGPVFFRQLRVGRGGKAFKIWKFRSMAAGADSLGPNITASGDQRITGIGKYLRRWKLDELPQLWNVVKGDMSLVGPRPELPFYVRVYTEEQRAVFSVRPGITDLAALEYRNEEEILAAAVDRERFYKEVILPDKLRLNLEYIQRISLRLDLALILMTLRVMPRGPMPRANISKVHTKTTSCVSGEEVLPCVKNALHTQSIHQEKNVKG